VLSFPSKGEVKKQPFLKKHARERKRYKYCNQDGNALKILLIYPAPERFPISVYQYRSVSVPAVLTHLAALTSREHQVTLVDMMLGDPVPYNDAFDLVGITVRTPMAPVSYQIADRFRAKEVKVVLGGAHVSVLPEEGKAHADAVVIGEAEDTWGLLINDLTAGRMADYYTCGPYETSRLKGRIRKVSHRPSLTGLPAPRSDLIDRSRYIMDTFMTTRGCVFGCRFCNVQPMFGSQIRHRPIAEVIKELADSRRLLLSVDDNIFGAPGDAEYYLQLYGEMKGLKPGKYWAGQGSLAVTSYPQADKLLETASRSGLSLLTAGIEALDCSGLEESGAYRKLGLTRSKEMSAWQATESIKKIQNYGINLLGYFIIGFRQDTMRTFDRILEFCDRYSIIPVPILLHPLPGTELYEEYVREGLLRDGVGWADFDGAHFVIQHDLLEKTNTQKIYVKTVVEANSLSRRVRRNVMRLFEKPRIDSIINFYKTQQVMHRGIGEYLNQNVQ
jgi:radical SAM superfamily enzyme YgiQ (UPF0313 family)